MKIALIPVSWLSGVNERRTLQHQSNGSQIAQEDVVSRPAVGMIKYVRRLAAVFMLVVFTSLNAMDGICCPDGCTHEEAASSAPMGRSTDGASILCMGGVQGRIFEHVAPAVLLRSAVTRVAAAVPHDVPLDPPEHPPRS